MSTRRPSHLTLMCKQSQIRSGAGALFWHDHKILPYIWASGDILFVYLIITRPTYFAFNSPIHKDTNIYYMLISGNITTSFCECLRDYARKRKVFYYYIEKEKKKCIKGRNWRVVFTSKGDKVSKKHTSNFKLVPYFLVNSFISICSWYLSNVWFDPRILINWKLEFRLNWMDVYVCMNKGE